MSGIAVVTGASSGIGAEFCRMLDSRGLDGIWMVSRREDAMRAVSLDLSTPCRFFPLDLSTAEGRDSLASVLSEGSPEIEYLVNCAGLGRFGDSFSMDVGLTRSMIEVNVSSVVEVTSACIPLMHPGSAVITLCSEAAYVPAYRLSVYSASKAFVRSYLDSLRYEVASRGISVLEVSPGWVKTPFIDGVKSSHYAPDAVFGYAVAPEDVVSKAMADLGRGRKRSVCGLRTRATIALATHFPRMASWVWHRLWG